VPRGSKPGERRGGRQRGTPNKSTALKNAAIAAAASDPNLSPLDLLLNLMRQRDLPLEYRVTIAQQALPFAHAKPKALRPTKHAYGGCPTAVNRSPEPRVKVVRVSSHAADLSGITPLDFLLGVMRDAKSPPALRLRAAGIVAPYIHPKRELREEDEMGLEMKLAEDPYGFDAHIGDTVEAIRRDERRLRDLEPSKDTIGKDWEGYRAACREVEKSPEFIELEKSVAEKQATLKCPPKYNGLESTKDQARLRELEAESKKRSLTTAEVLERKHLRGRLYAYRFFQPRSMWPPTLNGKFTSDDEADLRRTMRLLPDDLSITPVPPPTGAA